MPIKDKVEFSSFLGLDIRVGKVIECVMSEAKKPTYRLTVDFGEEIGLKKTVGAYTHYPAEKMIGLQVLGIVNVGTMKMGPEISEFLCIGLPDQDGNAVPLTPLENVPIGGAVF